MEKKYWFANNISVCVFRKGVGFSTERMGMNERRTRKEQSMTYTFICIIKFYQICYRSKTNLTSDNLQ